MKQWVSCLMLACLVGFSSSTLYSLSSSAYLLSLSWPDLTPLSTVELQWSGGSILSAKSLVFNPNTNMLNCIVSVNVNGVTSSYVAVITNPFTGEISISGLALRSEDPLDDMEFGALGNLQSLWGVSSTGTDGVWIVGQQQANNGVMYLVNRLDSGATFTGPSGIASVSGGKYLMIASATPNSPLFSLNPSDNFYREDVFVDLRFPIGENVRFLSNYDDSSFFLGQGSGSSTDIYLVNVQMNGGKSPYTRIHLMPTVSHASEGLAFYPAESQPIDTYDDLASGGERVGPLMAVMSVCVLLLKLW